MADREEKLKAARDKLEKFRKKKNSSRPEGSISGGPDGPGGLDGPDGSISPFPTAPAEEVSESVGGGAGGLAAYFGQQNDSFAVFDTQQPQPTAPSGEDQQQTQALDQRPPPTFEFQQQELTSESGYQQQPTVVGFQQPVVVDNFKLPVTAVDGFQQYDTYAVYEQQQQQLLQPTPVENIEQPAVVNGTSSQFEQQTAATTTTGSFEQQQQQNDIESIRAAYSGLSQFVPQSQFSHAVHAGQSIISGHAVLDSLPPRQTSSDHLQDQQQQQLQEHPSLHQEERQEKHLQNDQAGKIAALETELCKERSQLVHERQLLEQERSQREAMATELEKEMAMKEALIAEMDKMRSEHGEALNNISDQNAEVSSLREELANKNNTIQLIVAEKAELQSKSSYLEEQCRLVLQEKELLHQEIKALKETCQELRSSADDKQTANTQVQDLTIQQIKLKTDLDEQVSENQELQGKLRRVAEEQEKDKALIRNLESELEINKVHLIQLRSTGGETSTQEIKNLNAELATTRTSLTSALASRDKLAADRDRLAEQYRNYSKDLAIQAERLSEQLRRYQNENARLVQRDSELMNQIEQMERQMQKYIQGGKNVTEEENTTLRTKLGSLETEARQTKEANNKLQQMYAERSDQVEEMMKRLTQKEAKVIELQGQISGLETTNEMLKSESGIDRNKAEFLAAMESDKVAASRALQQNAKLKLEIEELQRELVNLINSKAEVVDQLEDQRRKVDNLSGAEGTIAGLQESIREREMTISNMRNQIKYLENEINKATDRESSGVEDVSSELHQAREYIRSLSSVNSELRSQIEVLSSRTRECSESRSPSGLERSRSSSSSLSDSAAEDSTLSSASDSFVEVNRSSQKSSAKTSDSFVQLGHESSSADRPAELVQPQSADLDQSAGSINCDDDITADSLNLTVVDNLKTPTNINESSTTTAKRDGTTIKGEAMRSPPDNLEAWRQLETRFIAAMNRVAALSSDKEQLEHLVTRLQDETETITDYIIMYQHQRKQQKLKMQEKDVQLQQLSMDKEKLQSKLADLHALVDKLVANKQETGVEAAETSLGRPDVEGENETAVPGGGGGPASARSSPGPDTDKIYKLLSEIQADSEHIVSNMENFQPYFFDYNNAKVITV